MLGLLFDPDDIGDTFLRNFGISPNHKTLQHEILFFYANCSDECKCVLICSLYCGISLDILKEKLKHTNRHRALRRCQADTLLRGASHGDNWWHCVQSDCSECNYAPIYEALSAFGLRNVAYGFGRDAFQQSWPILRLHPGIYLKGLMEKTTNNLSQYTRPGLQSAASPLYSLSH